jgi:hypothetical protein
MTEQERTERILDGVNVSPGRAVRCLEREHDAAPRIVFARVALDARLQEWWMTKPPADA